MPNLLTINTLSTAEEHAMLHLLEFFITSYERNNKLVATKPAHFSNSRRQWNNVQSILDDEQVHETGL